MAIKDSKYVKINGVNPLYLVVGKIDRYFEEISENEYLTLVPTNESKNEIMKKYEELLSKITDLITSITNNSNDYDEKYMKDKFNLDNKSSSKLNLSFIYLDLNKTLEVQSMIIVVGAIFHENNKWYPQVFLDECLYKL